MQLMVDMLGVTELSRALGLVLGLGGAAVCVYWLFHCTDSIRGQLLTFGPYRYVRHPLYSGFLAVTLGAALTVPCYEAWFIVAFTALVYMVYLPKEEEALMEMHQEKYAEYVRRVRYRLLPWLI